MIKHISDWEYSDAVNFKKYLPQGLGIVVDLGAGKRDSPVSTQVKDIVCEKLVSVEAFEPYLESLLHGGHSARLHDVVHAHITNSNYKIPECDLVLMLDVIEHLEKEEAYDLIFELQKKAKCIIIFTPEGDTIGYSNHDMNNALQEHQSAWTEDAFDWLGFDVVVYEGFHKHIKDEPVGAMWAIWYKNE